MIRRSRLSSRQKLARLFVASLAGLLLTASSAVAQVAVRGKILHTQAGMPIEDGMVLIQDGKISAIGKAADLRVPENFDVLEAAVVTPGLIDAHATVGFSGILNYDHDQDQLERSAPIQPELRAIDAYNPKDPLVEWVRNFGITTMHTGHAPGELISGQTLIVKTVGDTVEEALLRDGVAVAATLTGDARKSGAASPGTRGKMVAMLRSELIRAQEYLRNLQKAEQTSEGDQKPDTPPRDLRLESLVRVLKGEVPLLVTADRSQDINSALRLAREFQIKLWLDSGAEAYLLLGEIQQAGVPVIVHPTMARAMGDRENLTFENAGKLSAAGIPISLQSGYEPYVPKTRVVLFEAAVAAAHGLPKDRALAAITSDAAALLGIADRVGSLEVGKDGDLALFDGDPFEYTTHCVVVVINGQVVSRTAR